MRFTLNVQRRLIHLEGCSCSVLLKSAIEILMQLQKDWMHRWSVLLFLSFFSPIFSTSLFLFSSLLHLAQPLFLSFSSFLSCLILLSFRHCHILIFPSFCLLHNFIFLLLPPVFISPLPSCHCLVSSHSPLSLFFHSPLLILITSPHVSFYCLQYSQFLLTSLLISSCLISSHSHFLLFIYSSCLLFSSLFLFSSPLFSPHSHLISSHISLQFSHLILCYDFFSLLLFTASKISSTIPKRSVFLIWCQSSFCSSSPFYSSINLLHIVFYLNKPLISDE